jgi:hypothetical protein
MKTNLKSMLNQKEQQLLETTNAYTFLATSQGEGGLAVASSSYQE